jgi:succinate dehydrogenase/fumarate reductase cytochrome b subunit
MILALSGAPTGVQLLAGKVFIMIIMATVLFHGLNGIRLLVTESSSWGINYVGPLFRGIVIMTSLISVVSWVII